MDQKKKKGSKNNKLIYKTFMKFLLDFARKNYPDICRWIMFEEHITPGHLSSTHSILDIGHTEYQQTEIQHQFSLQYFLETI